MIVVVIIGLLATMAMPALVRAKRRAQNVRFINDLRIFSGAFEVHALEAGAWPPDALRGVVPVGMTGEFDAIKWAGPTPVGGRWDYDANNFGVVAGVSVVDPTVDVAQMREIDDLIDDGNLNTGFFRQSAATRFTMALQR